MKTEQDMVEPEIVIKKHIIRGSSRKAGFTSDDVQNFLKRTKDFKKRELVWEALQVAKERRLLKKTKQGRYMLRSHKFQSTPIEKLSLQSVAPKGGNWGGWGADRSDGTSMTDVLAYLHNNSDHDPRGMRKLRVETCEFVKQHRLRSCINNVYSGKDATLAAARWIFLASHYKKSSRRLCLKPSLQLELDSGEWPVNQAAVYSTGDTRRIKFRTHTVHNTTNNPTTDNIKAN